MILRTIVIGCFLAVGATTTCSAQVIQLPTFQFFSVSTTVSVPDGGAAYLGGVNRAQYGSTSRGVPGLRKLPGAGRLFANRGIGSSLSSSGASVTATIIDHAEMDALLLAEAAGRRTGGEALSETDRKALVLSSHIGRRDTPTLRLGGEAPRESVAAIRLRNDVAARAHVAEMHDYWQRGQYAESLGRWGAARVSYDVIARRGSGELRDRAISRLKTLRGNTAQVTAPASNDSNVAEASTTATISPRGRNR